MMMVIILPATTTLALVQVPAPTSWICTRLARLNKTSNEHQPQKQISTNDLVFRKPRKSLIMADQKQFVFFIAQL